MKKLILILITGVIITLNVATPAFSASDSPEAELPNITKDIPWNWWEGGWDKSQELEELIVKNSDKPCLCAEAQYYIGCFYFSIKEYTKAIDAYTNVLINYPQASDQCQKAQYEIAQIYMNHLNDPEKAISEYQRVISAYPESIFTPIAYLMIGKAYVRLGDSLSAEEAFKKVIDNYPEARDQRYEAYMELGDLSINRFALSPDNKENGRQALSYYKNAYLICKPHTVSFVIDRISRAFRTVDMSMARARQFIKYQKYGHQGEDGALGTRDDLTNPLAGF